MTKYSHLIYNLLKNAHLSDEWAIFINMLFLLAVTLTTTYLVDIISRKIIIKSFSKLAHKSKTNFDDILVENKTPRNLAHIIPFIIFYNMITVVFVDYKETQDIIFRFVEVIGVVMAVRIIRSLLNTFKDYFKTLPRLKDKPVDSYIQVFMIFVWVTGIIISFAILTDTSIWKFLTAMGAASAVILLIFKDTILGFVASIQVSINDMVRIGDWITFEKYGADGDVVEINLATVKVQNFDKTITTIPTYALISDSFKNWRGMMNSDGRRIKRSLLIKLSSVHYLSNDEIDSLKDISIIKDYLEHRQIEINGYNEAHRIDKSLAINGRNMTNLGVFRKYIETYVANHSATNKDMMIMTRQLAPTAQGMPLEIYAFSSDKRWQNYEYIMADIFDHCLAAVPYFNLEIFELPNNNTWKQ